MPLVKILKDYRNAEGWKVGQIVDVTNPWTLIREGKVVLVDEQGKEIEHPDILMQIRSSVTSAEAIDLIGQIISKHPKKNELLKALREAGVEEKAKQETPVQVAPVPSVVEAIEAVEVNTPAEVESKVEEVKRKEVFGNAAKVKIK